MRAIIACFVLILLGLFSVAGLAENKDLNEIKRLAQEGDSHAQFYLGLMYYQGESVGQDYSVAMKWFKMAAEQGIPEAQYNLGIMYSDENANWHSFSEAMKWFQKAAEQNFSKAQYNLGVMYALGEGVAQDNIKAYAWLSLAYFNGDLKAKNILLNLNRKMNASEIEKAADETARLRESTKK